MNNINDVTRNGNAAKTRYSIESLHLLVYIFSIQHKTSNNTRLNVICHTSHYGHGMLEKQISNLSPAHFLWRCFHSNWFHAMVLPPPKEE